MNASWAIKIDLPVSDAAAALRLVDGVEGCVADNVLWLRGSSDSASLDLLLRKIGRARFTVGADGYITHVNQRVPCGRLPAGPWVAAPRLFHIDPPTAALPASQPKRAPVELHRGGAIRDASVLRAQFQDFSAYAVNAPEVRLRSLRFAASPDGQVILWGPCLPPISGKRSTESYGVAIPCGFGLSPAVGEALLARMLGITAGTLAVFDESGVYEIIPADCFVDARRSAVRRTSASLTVPTGGQW